MSFGKETFSLNDLQSGINNLFEQVWHSGIRTRPFDGQDWSPTIDVIDKYDCYVIDVELPGVNKEDVNLATSGNQLIIKGQKVHSATQEESEAMPVSERRFGSFSRVLTLFEPIKPDGLTASMNNGVLQITAPKKTVQEGAQRKIKID